MPVDAHRRAPSYLAGYPPALVHQVTTLIEQGRFASALRARYPDAHAVRSDSALYDYVQTRLIEAGRHALGQIQAQGIGGEQLGQLRLLLLTKAALHQRRTLLAEQADAGQFEQRGKGFGFGWRGMGQAGSQTQKGNQQTHGRTLGNSAQPNQCRAPRPALTRDAAAQAAFFASVFFFGIRYLVRPWNHITSAGLPLIWIDLS